MHLLFPSRRWFLNLVLQIAFVFPITFAALVSLTPQTIASFDTYVARTDRQDAASLRSPDFFWIDALPADKRSEFYAKLRSGEVLMRRADDPPVIPDGMIHDWQGIVFIPGAKLPDTLRILQDYDHQSIYYAPDVTSSKLLQQNGDQYRFFLRFRREKVVTVVLDTEHQVRYFSDSPTRAHSRSSATRISEVQDPGTPQQKELPPGSDNGFLWRMETWWHIEEKDGGVYLQCRVVSLTRSIPFGLAWLIEPFVTSIPKESLSFTLNSTRKSVLANHL